MQDSPGTTNMGITINAPSTTSMKATEISNQLVESDQIELNGHLDGKGTVMSSSLALINTMMGSGMIATPYAFKCLGFLQGFLWILISGMMSSFSIYTVGFLAAKLGPHSNFFLASQATIPQIAVLIDVVVIIQGFGVCISYLILIGNALPFIILTLGQWSGIPIADWVSSRLFSLSITMILFLFPTSMIKSVRSLRFTGLLAIICILYMSFVVVAYFFLWSVTPESSINGDPSRIEISLWKWDLTSFLKGLPIFVFGLTCQHNVFKIFHEMKSPKTVKKITKAGLISTLFTVTIYSVVASLAYVTLGENVDSKLFDSYDIPNQRTSFSFILDKFDPQRVSLNLARLALVLLVMCAFPMQLHPVRDSITQLSRTLTFFIRSKLKAKTAEEDIIEPEITESANLIESQTVIRPIMKAQFSWKRHFIQTFCFCLATFLVAIAVENFSRMLAFIGATGSNATTFVFGPLMFLYLYKKKNYKRIFSIFLIVFAAIFAVAVISFEIKDIFQ